jgi:hypothetical protein
MHTRDSVVIVSFGFHGQRGLRTITLIIILILDSRYASK